AEVTIMRKEIQEDLLKTREAAIAFVLGAAAAGVSAILIGFTAVYVFAAVSALPLWGSFPIVAGLFVIAAGVLFFMGKQKLDALRPRHDLAGASSPRAHPRP